MENKILNIIALSILLLIISLPVYSQQRMLATSEYYADNYKEDSLIESLSVKLGYAYGKSTRTDDNGGVSSIEDPESNGFNSGIRTVLRNGAFALFKPYLDFSAIFYDDRQFYIPTIGLRHDIYLDNRRIVPYLALGVGANFLKKKDKPNPNGIAIDDNTFSANLTLEGGIDFYFNKHWAIDASIRADFYSLKTVVGGFYSLSTLEDYYSASVLVGAKYYFGDHDKDSLTRNPTSDDDEDGVIALYDRCPDTLKGVPVSEGGCVLYKFDFSLSYNYNEYKVEDLLYVSNFSIVEFLNRYKDYKVKITGYADNVGKPLNNQIIAKRRAVNAKVCKHIVC